MSYRDYEKLEVSDTEEDLFASPSRSPRPSRQAPSTHIPIKDEPTSSTQSQSHQSSRPQFQESKYDAEASRDDALKKELASLKHMNEVIEGVISSLSVAKGNMRTVETTVGSASTLLNTWTRILSQTEHNQRLILNPGWKGASMDAVEAENEVILRKQAEERRAAEEQRRREEARRKAEDEERARQAGTDRPTRGTRGGRTRGRVASSGYGRTTSSSASGGYVGVGGQSGMQRSLSQGRRGGTGIGRDQWRRGYSRERAPLYDLYYCRLGHTNEDGVYHLYKQNECFASYGSLHDHMRLTYSKKDSWGVPVQRKGTSVQLAPKTAVRTCPPPTENEEEDQQPAQGRDSMGQQGMMLGG